MKTKKVFLYLLILFSVGDYFAQTQGIVQFADRYPSTASVRYYLETGCYNSYSYTRTGSEIGSTYTSTYDSQLKCYRNITQTWNRAFRFNFSLPTNAVLTKVELLVSSNYSAEIVGVPADIFSYTDPNFFNTINNGSNLFSLPASAYQDITSYASQFLSNGAFCVGARSTSNTQVISISCRLTYEIPAHLTFQNNMGGQLNVNGSNYTGSFSNDYWLSTNISLSVNEPQTASSYTWVWNDSEAPSNPSRWDKIKNSNTYFKSNDQSYSFSVTADDHNSTYKAMMRKVCNATFQSAGGTVYLDGTHSSPYTVQVVEQNSVTATADNYYDQGLYYRFQGWNGSNSSTVTLYETSTYTASYTREPSLLGMDFTLVSGIGSNPTLTWNEHQSTDVTTYRIYRTIKNIETDVLIAELNRGTTTYTDYSRIITNNDATNNLTFYRLRVVLTPENLESEEWGQTCYTTVDMKLAGNDNNITTVKTEVPEDFSISSYPNPFNPTTTINYQLPENSFVIIKVYDILGKEIATLVNESKSAGFHNVNFDASRLTSGIYIYTISANNFIQSKKMILMK